MGVRRSGWRALGAAVLGVALVGSVTSSIRLAPSARASDPGGDPVAVVDLWTPHTQVWRNPDGTLTATLHSAPVQAPDPTAPTGWSPLDTDLTVDDGELTTENADIVFSSGGEAGPLASVSQDGLTLAVGWDGDLPAPSTSGDTATYPEVLPGVDATLQATPQGFEQSFVVDSPAAAPRALDVPLVLDGLAASVNPAGALVLTDASGQVVRGADPAQMWGSRIDPDTGEPAVIAAVATTLVQSPGGPVLHLQPDPGFFTDPAVSFPVVIDPAVSLSLTYDTYVDSATPATSYATSAQLRSGRFGTGGPVDRTFLSFEASALAGVHVLSATLYLYETSAPSCTPSQVDAYSVPAAVSPPVTWNNQPGLGNLYASASAAKGYSGSCPAGWIALSGGGANGAVLGDLIQA